MISHNDTLSDDWKFSVRRVIRDHWRSLRGDAKAPAVEDLLFFVLLPPGLALLLHFGFGVRLDSKSVYLITAVGLIAGFLFNSLTLLIGQARSSKPGSKRLAAFREIIANISFSIACAITVLPLWLVTGGLSEHKGWVYEASNLVTLFLLCVFATTIPLILNRAYFSALDATMPPDQ